MRTASTGKVFEGKYRSGARMIFPETRRARPCRWKRAVRYLCPRIGMTVLFSLPVPGFREREDRVVFRIESDGGIERYAFLSLEPLDQFGDAGGEKLFHVGVGQLLVQYAAEYQ